MSGDYYMLMASLPALPSRFDAGPAPITLQRLRGRWSLIGEEDQALLEQIADSLLWDRQPLERTDEEIVGAFEELVRDVHNPVIRGVITSRLEVRLIVSALRRQARSLGPPPTFGEWGETVRRNWSRPLFGLGYRLRWLSGVARLLERGDPLEAERAILGVVWDRFEALAQRVNYFSFESLVIYLAKRDAVMRWANLDLGRGRERFEQLVTEAMGEHSDLFGPGDRG